jgi:hypothetical protein
MENRGDVREFARFVESEDAFQPWHAAFCSSVERVTVVIGPNSIMDGNMVRREIDDPTSEKLRLCLTQGCGTYIAYSNC